MSGAVWNETFLSPLLAHTQVLGVFALSLSKTSVRSLRKSRKSRVTKNNMGDLGFNTTPQTPKENHRSQVGVFDCGRRILK